MITQRNGGPHAAIYTYYTEHSLQLTNALSGGKLGRGVSDDVTTFCAPEKKTKAHQPLNTAQ